MSTGRRRSRTSKSKRSRSPANLAVSATDPQDPLSVGPNQFASTRAGARNVAGVRYQALSALALLVDEPNNIADIIAVRPEGDEDIDVFMSGNPTQAAFFIQAKFRTDSLTRSELAGALVKAWNAGTHRTHQSDDFHVAVMSNAITRSMATGWKSALADHRDDQPQSPMCLLERAIAAEIARTEQDPALLEELFRRSHLVYFDSDVSVASESIRIQKPSFTNLQAQLAANSIFQRVIAAAALNRNRTPATAITVNRNDVDMLIEDCALASGAWLHEIEADGLLTVAAFGQTPVETRASFLLGVRAQPQHIGAGFAVPRVDAEAQLTKTVSESSGGIIVGPSGSGKSTLMWQVAASLSTLRCLHLHRVRNDDVGPLTNLIRSLTPEGAPPVLICADDLGDESLLGWPELLRRFASRGSVRFLATCREEDFSPGMTAQTLTVFRPKFDEEDAIALARQLPFDGGPLTRADVVHLYRDSRGLMLEFVYIALTSRRLKDVLDEQASKMITDHFSTRAQLARLVLTADLCGSEITYDDLKGLGFEAEHIAIALNSLADEHIIVKNSGILKGLHEVRSEYLVEALHRTAPPLASTLELLVNVLPFRAMRAVLKMWVRRAGMPVDRLRAAFIKRFLVEPEFNWEEFTKLALDAEACIYTELFARELPDEGRPSSLALLAGQVCGLDLMLALAFDGSDGADATLVRRAADLTSMLQNLPDPQPERKAFISELRKCGMPELRALTVTQLERFHGCDPFTGSELHDFMARVTAARDEPDPNLSYDPWRTQTAKLRLSSAWAAKAAAACAALGPRGLEAVRKAIGDSRARAEWMLTARSQLVRLEISRGTATAFMLMPHLMIKEHYLADYFLDILADAALVSDIPNVSLQVLFSDGGVYSAPTSLARGWPIGIRSHRQPLSAFNCYVDWFLALSNTRSWFPWLDRLAKSLGPVVRVLQDVITFLAAYQGQQRRGQALQIRRRVEDLIASVGDSVPSPPESDLPQIGRQGSMVYWAFGVQDFSLNESGEPRKTTDAGLFATKFVSQAIVNLLAIASSMISRDHLVPFASQEDGFDDRVMQAAEIVYMQLSYVRRFMANFTGTSAAESLAELSRIFVAFQIMASNDEEGCEISRRELCRSVLSTNPSAIELVGDLLRRLATAQSLVVAKERLSAVAISRAMGDGWQSAALCNTGRMGGSLEPIWVFVGPPASTILGPHIARAIERQDWLRGRCILAPRTLDGAWFDHFGSFGSNGYDNVSDVGRVIVIEALEHSESISTVEQAAPSQWSDLHQLVLLLDVLSREVCVDKLGGPAFRRDVDLQELYALSDRAPECARRLLDAFVAELRELRRVRRRRWLRPASRLPFAGTAPSIAVELDSARDGRDDNSEFDLLDARLACDRAIVAAMNEQRRRPVSADLQ